MASTMGRLRRWTAVLALSIVLLGSLQDLAGVHARSNPAPLVNRIHHPRSISFTVIPRSTTSQRTSSKKRSLYPPDRLLASDALRISLEIEVPETDYRRAGQPDRRRRNETVHLHLAPNEHLIHPQAKITTFAPDGSVRSSEPIIAEDHRVYVGDVIVGQAASQQRLAEDHVGGLWYAPGTEVERGVRGRTSMAVHQDGEEPVFEGMFTLDGQVYHVVTREDYERHWTEPEPVIVGGSREQRMVIFLEGDRDEAVPASPHHGCSHDRLAYNNDTSHPVHQAKANALATEAQRLPSFMSKWDLPFLQADSLLDKRDDISGSQSGSNFIDTIGQTAGCQQQQRIVYMGVAADCNYVATYGSAQAARTRIINNWNSISALYKSTFNVSVGIVELNVMDQACPSSPPSAAPWNAACSNSISLNSRLSTFSQWRGQQSSTAGLWHLMSACPTDTEVGVAWLGTLCQTSTTGSSGNFVSGTGVSTTAKVEWSLSAHEIGHNFGAIHDCTSGCSLSSPCCPFSTSSCNANAGFIMNPTTSSSENAFSPCTVGNICSSFQSNAVSTECLVTPGQQRTLSLQACGNGIVEEGEDCDPGQGVTSSCCDSTTCKFRQGAVCDPLSQSCCTSSCSFAPTTQVCRPAIDSKCDIAEYCTGTNATCPDDKMQPNGQSCGDNGLACASGQCTSLDQQCRKVGSSMNLSKACGQRNDRSCTVNCQSPGNPNQCLVLQSPLINGSPCGWGGTCQNQTCEAGSLSSTFNALYTQNLQYSIPITIAVVLLVVALLGCIFRCCCGGTRRKATKPRPLPAARRNAPIAPPPMHPSHPARDSSASNNPLMQQTYGVPYQNQPSVQPPPMTYQGGYDNDGWQRPPQEWSQPDYPQYAQHPQQQQWR